LVALNGCGPACDDADQTAGIDHQLASEKTYPAHTPERAKNQELTDRQAGWLTRRFLISAPLAYAIAPLAFGEVRR
jgi:hypothetical protein